MSGFTGTMRFAPFFFSLLVVGCAHVDRAQAVSANVYDVMSDAEVAKLAVHEALGELHQVQVVDAEGVVTVGTPAFANREERLAFERRVDALVRAQVYGQGPTLELVRIRCEQLSRDGWAQWPGDELKHKRACEYGDVSMTVHSLFKKPLLQRALVELMLGVVKDDLFALRARNRLVQLQRTGIEPYLFIVERWERVEGFRPRS